MARTFTAAQRSAVSAGILGVFSKIEVTDPDAAWRDISAAINGVDWFNTCQLSEDIDSNAQRFTLTVLRESGILSLAPLMTASLVNRNAAAAYAPMLELKRQWRVSVAVLPSGLQPQATDWREIGQGYIDRISITDDSPVITVTGRDLGAVLLDAYVDVERLYGSVGGTAMETVIQSVIDDNAADNGYSGITLYTPTSPAFLMNVWKQGRGNLMQIINAIAAKKGFVVRYRYDAANVLRLTLYTPNRGASVEDYSLGPDEYLNIPVNDLDISPVRTLVRVRFIDITTGAITTVISPASGTSPAITKYGRILLPIDLSGGDPINTTAKGQAFADVVVADTQTPAFEQQIVSYGLWFVQLGDYVKTLANGVHYDQDQFGGVTSIVHTLAAGTMRTTVSLKGKPAGRYLTWTASPAGGGVITPPTPAITPYAPQALAVPNNTESDDTTRAYALDIVAGSGGGGANLTWVLYQKIGFAAETTVNSGDDTGLPLLATITRHPRSDKSYRFVASDTSTGLTDTVHFTVPSARPEITDTGTQMTAPVTESGARAINRLYAKALSADPDSADAVAAGSVKRIPVVGASDSSGNIDMGGAGWVTVNRNAGNLRRSSGDATAVSTIVAQLANTGHAISTFQESGGKPINRLYAKTLAADADSADSVVPGSVKRIPLLGGTDSSGNIDLGGAAWVNRYSTNLARSSGDATGVGTIISMLANTGHGSASFQESGGKPINRLYAKTLAADADTADSVVVGIAKRIPLVGATDSSGNVNLAGSAWVNKTLDNVADTGVRFASPVPNATSDVTLIASAGVTLGGNNAVKTTAGSWDEQVYSKDGFTGGAFASVVATAQAGQDAMFGLNTDPLTNANYTSIDYAVEIYQFGAVFWIYESGVAIGSFAYSSGDVLAITYDGSAVRYFQNGTVVRAINAAANLKFFFDSSFSAAGSRLNGIRFGALSSNNAASIGDGNFGSGLKESSGTAINRLLAKGLAADPNTLDATGLDGITFKRIVSVNGSGQFTPSSGSPRFRCKINSSVAQASASTIPLLLVWDSAVYDPFALHSTTVNPGRITIPTGGNIGAWKFTVQCGFAGNVTGDRKLEIRKNGANIATTYVRACSNAGHSTVVSCVVDEDAPAVGDYFEAWIQQDSGGALNVGGAGDSFFTALHSW